MIRELFNLAGRTALITGGSRGLGLDMARAVLELGGRVVLVARKQAGLDAALASLDAPQAACGIAADIGDLAAIPALVESACARFGGIDILVNNAGISWAAPAESFPTERWQRVLDVNLTAPFLLAREVARTCMIPAGRGRILNVASIGGLVGNRPDLGMAVAAYNASKGGLISLTRALAGEWGRHGITVNALCPGFFITELSRGLLDTVGEALLPAIPLGRFGGEGDLIGPAMLLVTEAGRHITGQTIVVDGGMTSV